MGKIVGLTYDLKEDYQFKGDDPPDASAEFDPAPTVNSIVQALEEAGNKVVRIGNVDKLLSQIDNLRVDIVFNIAEGLMGRNRESQVPILLEMKGIPYVGSDALTSSLTLDKLMTKKILISEDIPTPKFFQVNGMQQIDDIDHMQFPLIVKPRYEGSSKGVDDNAKVKNSDELKNRTDYIIEKYKQPALVEEFIRGTEFTVGIIGNSPAQTLPVVQVKIEGELQLDEKFYVHRYIFSDQLEYICPAQIPEELNKKISDLALKAYKAVDCRDFGRVDFRVDKQGRPYVLEVNPLPCLAVEDIFMVVAKYWGLPFRDMINKILNAALERYGLN